jgi:hypothetical protein
MRNQSIEQKNEKLEQKKVQLTSDLPHIDEITSSISGARFKRGVRLYTISQTGPTPQSPDVHRYFVGTRRSRCELIAPAAHATFALISRGASFDEIASTTGISADEVSQLFRELNDAHLLEIKESRISLSQRFISAIEEKAQKGSDRSKDGAYAQLAHRITPELSQSRWLPGVDDSGVAVVSARQRAHIEISGDSRAAHQLFGILLASGVTNTLITPSQTRKSPAVEERDISAGFLRGSDIGGAFYQRMNALSKELSLFPMERLESAAEVEPDFHEQLIKIHFGDIDPEILAKWMSTGQDHLIISELDGAILNIGPMVIPGKTPCSRCFSLTSGEPQPDTVAIPDRDILPAVATHYLAGIVASLALQLIDTGESDLIGSVLVVDLLSLCNTEHIKIPRHPMCGCSW